MNRIAAEKADFEQKSVKYPLPLDKDSDGRYTDNRTFVAFTFFRIGRADIIERSCNGKAGKLGPDSLLRKGNSREE